MSHPDAAAPLPPARTLDRSRQWRIVGIVALVLIALWIASILARQFGAAPAPPPAPAPAGTFRATPDQIQHMAIQPVRSGDAPDLVQATGTIGVDENRSTPVLLPFSGQVADVMVQAGQSVRQGQPLLRVASGDYNAARNTLAAASAQGQTAAAQLKLAEDNAARQEAIYKTAGGALKDYRQAQSDLAAARAAAATAQSAVATARSQLALVGGSTRGDGTFATYVAPVSGVVVQRNVAPGQYIVAGGDKPLLTIADLSTVWLVAQIAESDSGAVKVGDPVTVTTPAYPGRTFSATIDNVGAALDPVTHRLPVRASVANTAGLLKPQMFASFAISRIAPGTRPVAGVLVPSRAVIHEGDAARVWVSLGGGLLASRTVKVADSGGGYDTVVAGLRPGDRIVTAGALFVNQASLGD